MTPIFDRAYWFSYVPENAPLFARNLPALGSVPVVEMKGVRHDQFRLLAEWGTPQEACQWLTHRYFWRMVGYLNINVAVFEDTHLLPLDLIDQLERGSKLDPDWSAIILGGGAYVIKAATARLLDRKIVERKRTYIEEFNELEHVLRHGCVRHTKGLV